MHRSRRTQDLTNGDLCVLREQIGWTKICTIWWSLWFCLGRGRGLHHSGVSIRNCTKPLPGIKVHNWGYTKSNAQFWYIIMVIKESTTRILYIIIVLNFFNKKSYYHLKSPGLCWFFHETWWFFEVLEIPRTGRFLNLIFFFQIPKSSNSLILKTFKYPELTVLCFWIFQKPGTGGYCKNQIPTHWSIPFA
jgi:hypothetical protein